MEKFYTVIISATVSYETIEQAKEAAKKFLTDENSKCQTAIVMESVLAFERPEPQIVEHNLSGRRKRKIAPVPEKKRKAKEAPKEEAPVG